MSLVKPQINDLQLRYHESAKAKKQFIMEYAMYTLIVKTHYLSCTNAHLGSIEIIVFGLRGVENHKKDVFLYTLYIGLKPDASKMYLALCMCSALCGYLQVSRKIDNNFPTKSSLFHSLL